MLALKRKKLRPPAQEQPATRNKPVSHRAQKSEEKHCFPLVPCLNRTGATCDERRRNRIETIEKDYGRGFSGHCIGTWGLCTAQRGDATTTKKGLRKIASGTQQFVVGHLAQKARSRFGLAFFFKTNKFSCYWSLAFTGEDMPPMTCHVPCIRIHVCVIRILSVLISAPALFAHVKLIR